MKKLFSFVCALVCAISLNASDLYLVPNSNWLQSNARFAVYAFGNGETWVDMVAADGATNTYKATIDDKYPNVIFCRMNPNTTENNWDNKWNQTSDLDWANAGANNCYTVKEGTWDKGGGTWSVFNAGGTGGEGGEGGDPTPDPDPAPTVNYYLVGTAAENGWDAAKAMPMVDDQIVRSLSAGVYEFKVLKTLGSWDGALGYSNVNAECSSAGYEENAGNVKIVLANAGDVTIKVVDSKICVTGEIGGTVTITSYTICGESALLGSKWSQTDTNNDMTETETGIWILVKKNLTLEAKDYEYKLVANHAWGVKDIPSSGNNKLTIETAGSYEVTFTFNATTDELSAVAKSTPSALSNIEVENAAVKIIRDGQVFIVREGVIYNMMGQVIQ